MAILSVDPVGNYAVRIRFDDMHSTGIYSWAFLHDLGLNAGRAFRNISTTSGQGPRPRQTGRALRPMRMEHASLFRGRSAVLTLRAVDRSAGHAPRPSVHCAAMAGRSGLAISADGSAISGSFDSTAIRWSLTRNAAEQVLRFHADAVNGRPVRDGRAATAGADGRIAIWTAGKQSRRRAEGHTCRSWRSQYRPTAPRSPASWTIRCGCGRYRWRAARARRASQNVNGVAFAPTVAP
jgi:hypothetical protein